MQGGTMCPHLLDHLKTLWKSNNFFGDFLKVYNELGKVKKFRTSRPLFSWRNSCLKKVRAPALLGFTFHSKQSEHPLWLVSVVVSSYHLIILWWQLICHGSTFAPVLTTPMSQIMSGLYEITNKQAFRTKLSQPMIIYRRYANICLCLKVLCRT